VKSEESGRARRACILLSRRACSTAGNFYVIFFSHPREVHRTSLHSFGLLDHVADAIIAATLRADASSVPQGGSRAGMRTLDL